jgi:predicted small lipoprotein YifL
MKTPLRLILPVALIATLAGCGNKGPLVHPQSPADEMAVPATTAPATPSSTALPAPASTAPAAPADASLPAPASAAPATPVESTVPPADGGG